MTKEVMISLLNQGNTGNEILQILDSIVDDSTDNVDSVSVND